MFGPASSLENPGLSLSGHFSHDESEATGLLTALALTPRNRPGEGIPKRLWRRSAASSTSRPEAEARRIRGQRGADGWRGRGQAGCEEGLGSFLILVL